MTPESTDPPELAWIREVAATVRDVPGRAAPRNGFVERRRDVRVAFGTGRPATVEDRVRAGLSCEIDGVRIRAGLEAESDGSGVPAPEVDPETGLDLAGEVVRAAARAGVRVRGAWIASDQRVAIVDPGREPRRDRRRGARVRLEAWSSSSRNAAVAVGDHVVSDTSAFDADAAVDALAARAAWRARASTIPAGRTVAVFGAGVGGLVVHELVGHALEGDAARAGSRLAALDPPSFRDPTVRIVDDPRRARVPWTVDDEGEPARAVPLVERGQVVGRLLDRRLAADAGVAATGHARRASYLDDLRPRMGCTFLAAGPCEPREILDDTARGVLVHRMTAASSDVVEGVAWFRVADADRIESGRVVEPLRPFVLEIRVDDFLDSLDRVASDLAIDRCVAACVKGGQPLAVSVGSPTIRTGVTRVLK